MVWKGWKERNIGYLLLLPALVSLFGVFVYPIFYCIFLSFNEQYLTKPYLGMQFVGLANYLRSIFDARVLNGIQLTAILVSGILIGELLLGIGIALLLDRELKGKVIFRSIILIPMVVTPVVTGLSFRTLMFHGDFGMINYFLSLVGIRGIGWLADPVTALPAIMLTDIWQWTPYMALVGLAALESMPRDPLEAAKIDGASRLQTFMYVTLPSIWPVLAVAVIFRIIDSIQIFDIIYVMTSGGPGIATETLNMYAYKVGFVLSGEVTYAAAIAMELVLIVIVVTLVIRRFVRT